MTGSYQITNELLGIKIKQHLLNLNSCNDQAMNDTYLGDIARVVDYSSDDDRLVLEWS